MKKKFSLSLLFISIILYFSVFFYINAHKNEWFNYHITNFIEYIILWTSMLFILSLLAFKLNQQKYKTWMIVSIVLALVSICLAAWVGDGGQTIMSFNGELTTFWLGGLYSVGSIIYFIIDFLTTRKSLKRF